MTLECWEELINVLLQFVDVQDKCEELEKEYQQRTGKNKSRNKTHRSWLQLRDKQLEDQVTCGSMMSTILASVRSQSSTSSGSSSDARGSVQSRGY